MNHYFVRFVKKPNFMSKKSSFINRWVGLLFTPNIPRLGRMLTSNDIGLLIYILDILGSFICCVQIMDLMIVKPNIFASGHVISLNIHEFSELLTQYL